MPTSSSRAPVQPPLATVSRQFPQGELLLAIADFSAGIYADGIPPRPLAGVMGWALRTLKEWLAELSDAHLVRAGEDGSTTLTALGWEAVVRLQEFDRVEIRAGQVRIPAVEGASAAAVLHEREEGSKRVLGIGYWPPHPPPLFPACLRELAVAEHGQVLAVRVGTHALPRAVFADLHAARPIRWVAYEYAPHGAACLQGLFGRCAHCVKGTAGTGTIVIAFVDGALAAHPLTHRVSSSPLPDGMERVAESEGERIEQARAFAAALAAARPEAKNWLPAREKGWHQVSSQPMWTAIWTANTLASRVDGR